MSDIIKAPETTIKEWASGKPLSLEELYNEIESQAYDSHFAVILNQEPKSAWIKTHPFAKNVKYIPIDKLEFMMTYFFGKWECKVISYGVLANSVAVHVRVRYWYGIKGGDGEWRETDGVGAVPLQLDENSSASDSSKIKSNAVQIGLPAAESYAFKDAVEKLGKIFGKDLNRKDGIDYGVILVDKSGEPRFQEILDVSSPMFDGSDESDLPEEMRRDFRGK